MNFYFNRVQRSFTNVHNLNKKEIKISKQLCLLAE